MKLLARAVSICIAIAAMASTSFAASPTDTADFTSIELTVKHGIVRVLPAEDNRYALSYDKSLYVIGQNIQDDILTLSVDVTNDIQNYKGKVCYIYLPKSEYDTFTINLSDYIVETEGINADYVIHNERGYLTAILPQGFDRDIQLTGKDAHNNLTLPEKDTGYTLTLKKDTKGFVSLPYTDARDISGTYKKAVGTVPSKRAYNFDLENSYLYLELNDKTALMRE